MKNYRDDLKLNKKLNTEYKIKLEPITAKLIESIENNNNYSENEKFDLDYFSRKVSMFDDFGFIEKIQIFGSDYLCFFEFLQAKMLQGSKYYIYEKYIKILITTFCATFGIDIEKVNNIYDDLVKSKYISIIQCACFDEPIITEPTIVYNYRLVNEKRAYNRNKKRESRANKKAEQEEITQIEETEEAPSEPLPEVPVAEPDTPIKPDDFGFGETYEENPFF